MPTEASAWTVPLDQSASPIYGDPILTEKWLYTGTAGGVLAVEVATGRATRVDKTEAIRSSPAAAAGRLLFADTARNVHIIDGESATLLSSTPIGGRPTASIVANENIVIVPTEAGLFALEEGHVAWSVAGRNLRTPILWEGQLLADVGGELQSLRLTDRSMRWTFQPVRGDIGEFVLSNGTLIATTADGVMGLDPTDGRERWRAELSGIGLTAPAASDILAYVASDRELVALHLEDGRRLWSQPAETSIISPVLSGSSVFLVEGTDLTPTKPATIVEFDANTGKRLRELELPGVALTTPIVSNDIVYLVIADGESHSLAAIDWSSAERPVPFPALGMILAIGFAVAAHRRR